MEEHYMVDDLMIASLNLPKSCPVRIDITEEYIRLYVGPRDWEWKRGCPDITGCGTVFTDPEEDND